MSTEDKSREEFDLAALIAIASAAGYKAEYHPTNPPKLIGFGMFKEGRFSHAVPVECFSAIAQASRRTYRASVLEEAARECESISGDEDMRAEAIRALAAKTQEGQEP